MGVAASGGRILVLGELGFVELNTLLDAEVARLELGARLAEAGEGAFGQIGIDDPTLEIVRDQVRRFAEREVAS